MHTLSPVSHSHLPLQHTHTQNVSHIHDVELHYSSSVISAVMLRSYCSLAMLNCPWTTQPASWLIQTGRNDGKKRGDKEGEAGYSGDGAWEETGSEAGTQRIPRKKKRCERSEDREVRMKKEEDEMETREEVKVSVVERKKWMLNENEESRVDGVRRRNEGSLSRENMS